VSPTETTARRCLAIVGVGLIGGSIGLAARRTRQYQPILGIGRDPKSLDRARELGCIDEGLTDLGAAAQQAQFLVFCTPVDLIVQQILKAARQCQPGTLITDAGSTKAAIVSAVERELSEHVLFVGSHPLAGSEKRGPEYARADLFESRLTLITPTSRTPAAAVTGVADFWHSLGSRVQSIAPEVHDEQLALTSHLPHVVAAALAGILPAGVKEFTATGFRDTTRIAAGDPRLWKAILAENGPRVADALERLQKRLAEFRAALVSQDAVALERLLVEAKKVRDDLGN
jgi:prephenate dehydrogenase